MGVIAFDPAVFRAQFPGLFLDPPYTDAVLQVYWNTATCYVSDDTYGDMTPDCRREVINLVVAHLITIAVATSGGGRLGLVQSASIDKISVQVQTFQAHNQLQWFYNQTPYGQQAYAILFSGLAGGMYLGGFNELGSFRRAGGNFTPPATQAESVPDPLSCALLTSPPAAPYTTDYGTIDGASVAQGVTIVAPCALMSAEFAGVGVGVAVTLKVWTGSDVDSGARFNLYYWDADDLVADGVPTFSALELDATGFTSASGEVITGLLTGAPGSGPNLVVLSGFDADVGQMVNLEIVVA